MGTSAPSHPWLRAGMAVRRRACLLDGGSMQFHSAATGILAARLGHLWFWAAMICMRFCGGPAITILD